MSEVLTNVEKALGVRGPVIIAGDLNVVEPDHELRYAVFGEWEYDFYRAFGRAGFADACRVKYPTELDYSWFGRPSPDGSRNGYRLDHAFVNNDYCAGVVECRDNHSVRIAGLTDHSALMLTLALTS